MNKKVAIITGASTGIGKHISVELAKKEYIVILISRSKDKLKSVKKTIDKNGHDCIIIESDISKDTLLDSDEIFCSSSTNPVVPITQLDDKLISKNAGPITMKIYNHAQDFIKDL